MTHATGHSGEDEKKASAEPTASESGADLTKETLKRPEVQSHLKLTLIKGGLALRARAETPGTRQHLMQSILDQMTHEAQVKFIEDTQGFLHMIKEGVMGQFTMGLRSIWKAAAPSLAPKDWVELSTFDENEVLGMISIGGAKVDEQVAKKADESLPGKVRMLKGIAFALNFVPEIGPEAAEIVHGIAHVAEAPAEFLAKVFPEVREAVRNGGVVGETVTANREAINGSVPPQLRLIDTPPEMRAKVRTEPVANTEEEMPTVGEEAA